MVDSPSEEELVAQKWKEHVASAEKAYNKANPDEAKMLEKDVLIECDHPGHFDILSYLPYDNTYFTDAYVKKQTFFPHECFRCTHKFTTVDHEEHQDQYYKVSKHNQVFACKDAMDGEEDCVKAFCSPCYSHMINNMKTKRSR